MSEKENNDNIMAEIGEAIKTMNAENAEPQVAAAEAVGETEKETPEGVAEGGFTADDGLIERAVKAGLTVADAKSFANAEQADRILKALESKVETPKTGTKGTSETEGEGFPAEGFEKLLKELDEDRDDEGNSNYDPKILGLLKQMGALLKTQAKEIVALKGAGATAAAQTSFEKAFSGLDEGVRSHVDAATKSQLKKKYDFLRAAHESAEDGASEGEIFEEARKLVLGGIESKAGAEDKAAKLERRRSLALARPGGESGQRQDGMMTEEDIANALFKQLTK